MRLLPYTTVTLTLRLSSLGRGCRRIHPSAHKLLYEPARNELLSFRLCVACSLHEKTHPSQICFETNAINIRGTTQIAVHNTTTHRDPLIPVHLTRHVREASTETIRSVLASGSEGTGPGNPLPFHTNQRLSVSFTSLPASSSPLAHYLSTTSGICQDLRLQIPTDPFPDVPWQLRIHAVL